MTGIYQHTLDAKGRLFIPAKLREELGDTFYVTVSPEKAVGLQSGKLEGDLREGGGHDQSAAAQGAPAVRVCGPLRSRRTGTSSCPAPGPNSISRLTKSVTVVGSNNHAEFWDSARWDEICPLEGAAGEPRRRDGGAGLLEMDEINYGHKPVLLHECMDALAIKPDGVYLDGTLGRAGHSLEIVRRLTAGGRLIALDRDETAIEAAQRRLADYMDRVTLVHSNFSALDDVLREDRHPRRGRDAL